MGDYRGQMSEANISTRAVSEGTDKIPVSEANLENTKYSPHRRMGTVYGKQQYAITIKINNIKDPVEEDYHSYIVGNILPYCEGIEYQFETIDKKGKPTKMHVHGTMYTNEPIVYKDYKLGDGVQVYMRKVYSCNWKSYCGKNVKIRCPPTNCNLV